MAASTDTMIGVFGDGSAMMLALLVFLAAAVLAFGVMADGRCARRRQAPHRRHRRASPATTRARCAARA